MEVTVCTPAVPVHGAAYHAGYKLHGARAGGKRVFKCEDCGTEWVQVNEEDDTPPTFPNLVPLEDDSHRVIETGGPPQRVEALPIGNEANQVLLDALKRVAKGVTSWVAIVEIGPEGIPAATWSHGPVIYPLSAANALTFQTHAMLASYVLDDSEDDPDGEAPAQ